MKKIRKAVYPSILELDRQISEKLAVAEALPPGESRQKLLIEVGRLRIYAEMKRGSERAKRVEEHQEIQRVF
jgi:hypothetical protein